MLNFKLLNKIHVAICDLPRQPNHPEYSKSAIRQLEALDLVDDLLNGKSNNLRWESHYNSFCGTKTVSGASFSEEDNDSLLLEDLLESCEEGVLDALLVKYGDSSALGTRINEYIERFHVGEKVLQRQIQTDLSETTERFNRMLEETIFQKYSCVADYYNKIGFSRKLYSKVKNNSDYVLNRENALWIVAGLETDYWQFVRLFNAAGYSLREGNRRDTIIKFVVKNGNYTFEDLNEMLKFFGEDVIGA